MTGLDNLNHCSPKDGSVVLFSFGNYKVGRHPGRMGVNNATLYSEYFEETICPHLKKHKADALVEAVQRGRCSVWWVSTHFRMKGYFPDEQPDVIKNYNEDMRAYFERGSCGDVNYVDVYNMTSALAQRLPTQAEPLTYDSVHWGMEVNLAKAQIIIDALIKGTGARQALV